MTIPSGLRPLLGHYERTPWPCRDVSKLMLSVCLPNSCKLKTSQDSSKLSRKLLRHPLRRPRMFHPIMVMPPQDLRLLTTFPKTFACIPMSGETSCSSRASQSSGALARARAASTSIAICAVIQASPRLRKVEPFSQSTRLRGGVTVSPVSRLIA